MVPVAAVSTGLHPNVLKADGSLVTAGNPARGGDIVILFATGAGVTIPAASTGAITPTTDTPPRPAAAFRLLAGGREAEVMFLGLAPGTAGVVQINARIPEGVTAAADAFELRLDQ